MKPMPSHWSRGRVKWDTVTVAGATPTTEDDAYWLDGDDPAGTPFVAIADMSRRRCVSTTAKSLSAEGIASRKMPIGERGTLLLAMYASVGEVAFLDLEATWNQALLGITPNQWEVDAGFLRYVLLDMREDLLREVRSNTQANLNAGQIGDLWFQKPPLTEQKAIADYLDRETARIDTLIEEQQRLIERLRERRHALRVHVAPHGTTQVAEVESPLPWAGKLPASWRIVPLSSVAQLESGHTPSRSREEWWTDCYIPWVSLHDVGTMRGTKRS